ncbi:MAG: (4Fe-4S)-binding protein [Bacteroidia bacterium]|nr:(4Fe-4S)-binding protein [Bacteroidia bacterium]
MSEKKYKKEDLTINWNPGICIHSGICAKGLSSVFKPREKPWIQVDGANQEQIMKQIDACPSKALSYKLNS